MYLGLSVGELQLLARVHLGGGVSVVWFITGVYVSSCLVAYIMCIFSEPDGLEIHPDGPLERPQVRFSCRDVRMQDPVFAAQEALRRAESPGHTGELTGGRPDIRSQRPPPTLYPVDPVLLLTRLTQLPKHPVDPVLVLNRCTQLPKYPVDPVRVIKVNR